MIDTIRSCQSTQCFNSARSNHSPLYKKIFTNLCSNFPKASSTQSITKVDKSIFLIFLFHFISKTTNWKEFKSMSLQVERGTLAANSSWQSIVTELYIWFNHQIQPFYQHFGFAFSSLSKQLIYSYKIDNLFITTTTIIIITSISRTNQN